MKRAVATAVMCALVSSIGCDRQSTTNGARRGAEPQSTLTRVAVSPDSVSFGRVGDVAVDDRGLIYVVDELVQEVVVLNGSGHVVGRMGGRGAGPAEFRMIADIAVVDDALLVLDLQARNLRLFDAAGSVLRTWPWPADAGRPLRVFSTGSTAYAAGTLPRTTPSSFSTAAEAAAAYRSPAWRYHRIDTTGIVLPALAVADTSVLPRGFDCDGPGGTIATFSRPLFGRAGPLRAFDSNGALVLADRHRFRTDVVDTESGDTMRSFTRDFAPPPVTDAVWAAETRDYRERERTEGPFACDIESMRPRTLPVIRAIAIDEQDRQWIEYMTAPDSFAIAVVDAGGELVAEAVMPDRDPAVPFVVRRDRVYIVTRDENDVHAIAVYELRP